MTIHFSPTSKTKRATVCIMCTQRYTNTSSSRYRHSAISVQKLFPRSHVMTATTYHETQMGTTAYAVRSAMNAEKSSGISCHGGKSSSAFPWYTARPNGFASRCTCAPPGTCEVLAPPRPSPSAPAFG